MAKELGLNTGLKVTIVLYLVLSLVATLRAGVYPGPSVLRFSLFAWGLLLPMVVAFNGVDSSRDTRCWCWHYRQGLSCWR